MQHTAKLNLKKPELTDYVNIQDLNDNMDILDATVGELREGSASIPDLQTVNKTLAGAINEIDKKANSNKQTVTVHLEEIMPHKFLDNGKWYRWGFRTVNGEPQMIYE